MIDIQNRKACIVKLEPGDGTKYKFLITEGIRDKCVIISGLDCTRFIGSEYSLVSIDTFFQLTGYPPVSESGYCEWAERALKNDKFSFLSYVIGKSQNSNPFTAPFTAIASLVAVYLCYLKDGRRNLEIVR